MAGDPRAAQGGFEAALSFFWTRTRLMASSDPSKPSYLSGLSFDEFVDVLDELENDGPRGAVLLGSALLDDILKRLLLSRMIALTKDEDERLFGGMGPLATMSARVAVIYAFGLITKQTKGDLDRIRKIRNCFGHTGKKIDFDDPEIIPHCKALALSDEDPKTADERRKVYIRVIKALVVHLTGVISPDATP